MTISRRSLLTDAACALAAAAFGSSCSKKAPSKCTAASDDDAQARVALAYVDTTPIASKTCDGCRQWVGERAAGQCGGCKILGGPIHPNGYCRSFTPKG